MAECPKTARLRVNGAFPLFNSGSGQRGLLDEGVFSVERTVPDPFSRDS